ncbi:MAG: DUF2163 domain-containing protein [Hyphomicrobiaceae bacterium]
MRALSANFQAHLATGITTLAWCWRVLRRDGQTLGFTDHDRDLTFESTVFEAQSGMTASEVSTSVGLAVDTVEVDGALTSERLSEADLASGLYDGAKVEIWRVNWSEPAQRVLMKRGEIGEVRRTEAGFTAEIRGLTNALQAVRGRRFLYSCDAELGDSRCGVMLASSAYTASGTIVADRADGTYRVSGLESYASDWFTGGTARIDVIGAAPKLFEVRRHLAGEHGALVSLRNSIGHVFDIGDGLVFTAGCDKTVDTCRTKFANAQRFRGFPFMPGTQFLTRVAGRRG